MSRSGTGRVYQQKGSDVWWLDYSFRGKRHRESSGSKKKGDAVALLRKRLAEMSTGKLTGRSEESVMFEDLAEMVVLDYQQKKRKSLPTLRFALKHLRDYFGTSRALDITADRVDRYIAAREEEGAATATIQGELAQLRRGFNLAIRKRILAPASKPYIPTLRVQNAREGFFDPAGLERVIAELPQPEAAVVRFASLTGWRKSEILTLTWRQVDFATGIVRLAPGTTKNDQGREFPFSGLPPLEGLLRDQRERTRALERETGRIIAHVFHRDGRPIRKMDGTWRSACKRAGLEGWLFHDLRRTAVRNLEWAGVPRSIAMKLTGHKTAAVYERYAIAERTAMEAGVGKLAALHEQLSGAPQKVVPISRASGDG